MKNNKGPRIVTLEVPIEFDGRQISELTLQRPKVKHLKKMEAIESDVEKAVMLIATLASISESAVEELDSVDFSQCSEVIEEFMAKKPQKTGEKS